MPNFAAFLLFVQNIMGITITVLPTSSPVLAYAYNAALQQVSPDLANIPGPSATLAQPSPSTNPAGVWSVYEMAVYNLAGSFLVNFAQDPPGALPVSGGTLPYFAQYRKDYGLNGFSAGVVMSSSDQGTSDSLLVPKVFENISLDDLQRLKDPYGRQYLAIMQKYGTLWGLT
jgi:hypothetical protein